MGQDDHFISADQLPEINEFHGDLRIMADIIGVNLTVALCEAFVGTGINLYGWKAIKRRHRDQRIREAYDQGARVVDLAREHNRDERTIRKILGRTEEPAALQLKLF